MGGDGSGGAYPWSQMPLDPVSGSTLSQRQNIGRLTYDTGISVNMGYSNCDSGTDTLKCKDALVNVFSYGNAIKGYSSGGELVGNGLYAMVNPNLDAEIPVILGIKGSSGGHAIVCDGYGYNSATMYHHLNMGWAGSQDAWYDLPNIVTGFDSVYKCVYNIFESGTGEIIGGRILDVSDNPISGVLVSADGINDTTDSRGIYSLPHVSSGTHTVTATKSGHSFDSTNVTVGGSVDFSTVGNVWGINFKELSGNVHYVSKTGSHVSPFSSWGNAATNIQPAVDVAVAGEIVLVNDGTYYPGSQISVAKAITVESVNGAGVTIVNGSGAHRCFRLTSNGLVLDGFTITNGYVRYTIEQGAGVYSQNDGLVKNCIIAGNVSQYNGGGVYCLGAGLYKAGTFRNCVISGNSANSGQGGGVWANGGGDNRKLHYSR